MTLFCTLEGKSQAGSEHDYGHNSFIKQPLSIRRHLNLAKLAFHLMAPHYLGAMLGLHSFHLIFLLVLLWRCGGSTDSNHDGSFVSPFKVIKLEKERRRICYDYCGDKYYDRMLMSRMLTKQKNMHIHLLLNVSHHIK